MPPVGFEPTISADEPPQTYTLHCTATGTGVIIICTVYYNNFECTTWNIQGRPLRKTTAILPIHECEKAEDHKCSAPHNKVPVYTALSNTSIGNVFYCSSEKLEFLYVFHTCDWWY
jgi:hypothetical protein